MKTIDKRRGAIRDNQNDDTDFPVVVPFRARGRDYILMSFATELEERFGPSWVFASAIELGQLTVAKLSAGERLSVHQLGFEKRHSIGMLAGVDYYIVDAPVLTPEAVAAFKRRYPDVEPRVGTSDIRGSIH